MTLSRRAAALLLAVAAWNWLIWPNFVRNIWTDDRAFDGGPTGFLLVHVLLAVVSVGLGTAVGVLGWRALRPAAAPRTLSRR
jgi:intracellular septation protein A